MANEEQRRAFASYMGVRTPTAGSSQGQIQGHPVAQYPGAVAQPAHPYLFNVLATCRQLTLLEQSHGLGVLPAAPTPPPAAASSVASFPQAGYSQTSFRTGFGQGIFGQHGLPQRPGPLGQAQTNQHQQHMQQPGSEGYTSAPGYYNAHPPPSTGFNTGWQQVDQAAEQTRRLSGAPQGAMIPNVPPQGVMESHFRQTDDYYHYHQREQPQPPPQQFEEVAVPVMLCHTCSHCGQMRSAGFHRNNPVLPGKHLVPTACRRCKKRIKQGNHSSSSFVRIRSCTADTPCDWPEEPAYVDFDGVERRERQRNRAEVHVTAYSPERPRIVKRTSSQVHIGVGVLQQPPRDHRYERKARLSSLSPHRPSRDGEIWPPPDIVRMRPARSENVFSAPPEPLPNQTSKSNEVWPPPDIVRSHSFRTLERSASHRRSSRIVELSPSPPPRRVRTRSTRVVFRSKSRERRPKSRSRSPAGVRFQEQAHSEDAHARITAHPRPFRAVSVSRHAIPRSSDETSSNNDTTPRSRPDSPSRHILKPVGIERVMDGRRAGLHEPRQSIHDDLNVPHVHFTAKNRSETLVDRGRPRHAHARVKSGDVYEHFREYSRHRVVEKSPPAPPLEEFERLRIRRHSLSPSKDTEEEIRIDRARRISPSPQPTGYSERSGIRHASPLPRHERMNLSPRSPSSPEQPPCPEFRHVTRARHVGRAWPLTPPPASHKGKSDVEDVTDSDSAHSGEVTEVRSWRGLDENGRPATFVEQRRRVRMIEQGGERGDEFRPMEERFAAARSWRDV
ncbi:predicted protein [Plenodomus lingam JN3]|uniref:Predicted protein n=1 Tax=Leptosphaeria maculans (strain JN3 / isolate v23.1.3 / race Av1-4-5-6-7-8) TaxID=985895 RepID=E4ZVS5_LEPMJ|nr:predicted protein [Plenodomus lingam JN3]CBX95701.1 predicted protein [Plenodomus lingam JN3]